MPTGLLEFSRDPLFDTTPTYIDVSAHLMDATWGDGKHRDLDEPQAGTATFRLKNIGRRFEPEYAAGAYYPDIVPLRRFRWSVDGQPEGVWYATSWEVTYPAKTDYSVVVVSCVDGFGLLSLDLLDLLDPPSAESYEEVVAHDAPFAYYRMDDPPGTRMRAQVIGKGKRRRRVRRRVIRSELGGVSGPPGVYRGLPTLGADGLLLGDPDKAVAMTGVTQHARIYVEDSNQFGGNNELSAECWFKLTTLGGDPTDNPILHGPETTAPGTRLFVLGYAHQAGDVFFYFGVDTTAGTNPQVLSVANPTVGDTVHLVGTWDGQTLRLYVNGQLDVQLSQPGNLEAPAADKFFSIGESTSGLGLTSARGTYDEVAFYEHALTPERILAHYQAGAERGFPQQTAGERITAVVVFDLWAETGIQAGSHDVQPVMEVGQPKLEEISAAVKAEMPDSLFYFDGDGDPVYLGWNHKDGLGPQATIGDTSGEVPYQDIQLVYDDEMFNEVTVSHETADGNEAFHTATDQDSIDEYRHRAHTENSLPLVDHMDAEAVAHAILNNHSQPQLRVESITLNSGSPLALTQILERQIGDLIRVRRRGEGGTPIDIVTTILGKSKTLTRDGHLFCTWNTARGFNAGAGVWQLGIVGFSELNTTAVLA